LNALDSNASACFANVLDSVMTYATSDVLIDFDAVAFMSSAKVVVLNKAAESKSVENFIVDLYSLYSLSLLNIADILLNIAFYLWF
jgi:anti-anti-sigma regulatory factor